MKYIKTITGVYERPKDVYIRDNKIPCYVGFSLRWDDIIKESDTIDELCDEFIIYYANGYHLININDDEITFKDGFDYGFTLKSALEDGYEIYGAVWTKKEDKEPILKSVAKMDEKGCLKLFYGLI